MIDADIELPARLAVQLGLTAFGKWIVAALHKADISQAELGRALEQRLGRKFDRSAITRIINGQRRLYADELLAIVKITGIAPPGLSRKPDEQPLEEAILAGLVAAALGAAGTMKIDPEMATEFSLALIEAARTPEVSEEFDSQSLRVVAALAKSFVARRLLPDPR